MTAAAKPSDEVEAAHRIAREAAEADGRLLASIPESEMTAARAELAELLEELAMFGGTEEDDDDSR